MSLLKAHFDSFFMNIDIWIPFTGFFFFLTNF